MTASSVWTIGLGQCVSWGVLYYAFGVLVVPVERELGVARWLVTGTFSVALLVAALAAPAVGKLTDRGRGPVVMQAGGLIAAGLLALWAAAPTVWLSYAVWAGLGLCMAAVLYEPVFAHLGRVIVDTRDRIRAIATITVLGGLASTVFLPATAWLVDWRGWRVAVLMLASSLAIVTVAVHRVAFRVSERLSVTKDAASFSQAEPAVQTTDVQQPRLGHLLVTFACSSFVSSALATNLVPALMERRLAATTAATLAGIFGVMQLPGRLLLMNGLLTLSPLTLVWSSIGLQIIGLAALMSAKSLWLIVLSVSCFACGSGLVTLVRPYLVLVTYGANRAGRINGFIARAQQLARAAGPVAIAGVATVTGYGFVFALLASLLAIATAFTVRTRDSVVLAR